MAVELLLNTGSVDIDVKDVGAIIPNLGRAGYYSLALYTSAKMVDVSYQNSAP